VDAFPDKVFTGEVHEIRNNYAIQQNVVTYTVIVRTRNDDLTLRPGMTGYVTVIVGQRNRVTRVPNAVLRYEPEKRSNVDGVKQANHRTIWRLSATGQPEAIEVVLGLSDSRYSELLSGTVRDSDALIIGEKIVGGFAGPKLF
jgi:HlyD family secretion protein